MSDAVLARRVAEHRSPTHGVAVVIEEWACHGEAMAPNGAFLFYYPVPALFLLRTEGGHYIDGAFDSYRSAVKAVMRLAWSVSLRRRALADGALVTLADALARGGAREADVDEARHIGRSSRRDFP